MKKLLLIVAAIILSMIILITMFALTWLGEKVFEPVADVYKIVAAIGFLMLAIAMLSRGIYRFFKDIFNA